MQLMGRIRPPRTSIILIAGIIVTASVIAIASYASAGAASNTLVITPLVAPSGPGGGGGSGGPVNVTEIGENFESKPKKGKKVKGRVLSRLDLPQGIVNGNLVMDLIWTNSADVKGPLAKENAVLRVGLYFRDSDQREAKKKGYAGDCDDKTQRKFEEEVEDEKGHDHDVKTYVCPDTSTTATNTLSRILADGILASTVNGQSTLYLLADIPKLPKHDDDEGDADEELGSESPGQIKKLKFNITILGI